MNPCTLCSSTNVVTYISSRDIQTQTDLLKCRDCGLVFFESGHSQKSDDSYWNRKGHAELYEDTAVRAEFENDFRKKMGTIEQLKNKGRLLDVGCGLGHFLCAAREKNWDAHGIEISRPAAA